MTSKLMTHSHTYYKAELTKMKKDYENCDEVIYESLLSLIEMFEEMNITKQFDSFGYDGKNIVLSNEDLCELRRFKHVFNVVLDLCKSFERKKKGK